MKNIALFSDGTGNSAGKINKTNVWRLYKALDLSNQQTNSPNQLAYYDDGVGSSSFKLFALVGGAVGWGVKRNIIDLYTYLCRHYEPGDRIFCFGFSRGAFTIRVLADFVAKEGLVDRHHAKNESDLRYLATTAFRAYRKANFPASRPIEWARNLRDKTLELWHRLFGMSWYKADLNVGIESITFMGLWDTVDAYGLPIDELTQAWKKVVPLALPDCKPDQRIDRICHALALDDERHSFHPVLLDEHELDRTKQHPQVGKVERERVTQVWFAGVHSNVGGGYPDDALARIPLVWIADQATGCGLIFNADQRRQLEESSDVNGRIYDSRRGLAGFYRYQPRRLELPAEKPQDNVEIICPKIHESVLQRISGSPEYAPAGLPEHYAIVTAAGDIIDPDKERNTSAPRLKKELLETAALATSRATGQRGVRRLVWWRRVTYFLSVAAALWLVLFPALYDNNGACTDALCFLAALIGAVATLLPEFLSPWYQSFEINPGNFLFAAGTLTFLLMTGSWLRYRIRDAMQALWKQSGLKNMPDSPKSPSDNRIIRWLTTHPAFIDNRHYATLVLAGKNTLVWVTVVVVSLAALAGFSKVMFSAMTSAGWVCTDTAAPKPIQAGKPVSGTYAASSVCASTGYELVQGKRYRITLKVGDDWMDGGLRADARGLHEGEGNPLMTLFVPLRRYSSEPWFMPFGRIGPSGDDEYPLRPLAADATPHSELVAELVAKRDGELFLFVNDAVLPVGNDWQWFYDNNHGEADWTIAILPDR